MRRVFVIVFTFLAVSFVVESLKCYVGDKATGISEADCYDDTVKYCVKYKDYSFKDTYFFCDYNGLCVKEGFTNSTAAGITCCKKDDCNQNN
ncbi:hypothetical protein M3Y97_00647900 [Aphelenchoides bicaudatus]|nr:hypothetical protein M3Y97_00647900 [Aphelenchoides bicaudatus]